MKREVQLLMFAASLGGGKWAVSVGLVAVAIVLWVALSVTLVPYEWIGKPDLSVSFGAMFSAVLFYCCLYGALQLPRTLVSKHTLRFAPLARDYVMSLRRRLIWIGVALLVAMFILQPYHLALDKNYTESYFPLSRVTAEDFVLPGLMLTQISLYVWILARWVRAPFNLLFFPIYSGSNVASVKNLWWWPFTTFVIIVIGVLAWRAHAKNQSAPSVNSVDLLQMLDGEERPNKITRLYKIRWQTTLSTLRSRSFSSARGGLLISNLPWATAFNLGLVLLLACALVWMRAWAQSGFFVFLWATFASVLAMHARAIPLLPSMLLPIGLNRRSVAGTMLWVWFRRDLVFWLTSGVLASLWVALSTRFGVWMPFANAGRFPWAEPDPVVVHPSVGVMSFVAVGLGLALCTRLFLSATPQAASNQARFAWVRGIFVFIPPLLTFAIEVFLREHASQFPLLGSFTLRVLLAACVILPSVFFVYFLLVRRAWETANISRASETYLTTELKMMQNLLGRIDAGGVPRK